MLGETAKRFIVFAIGGVIVAGVVYLAIGRRGAPSMISQTAPDFVMADLESNQIRFKSLFGKPMVLGFWRHNSTACDKEMAALEALHREQKAKGLRVVGLVPDSTLQAANAYAREHGITFLMLHPEGSFERGKAVGELFHLGTVPRVVMIDANGVIRADLQGYHDLDQLRAALRESGIMAISAQPSDVGTEGEGGESVEVQGAANATDE
ncbi:MAG: peroxiredoxin family protein [Armatimonadota bacterium]